MKQKLIDALIKCGFEEAKTLFLQGTMNPNEPYPETFVTFWTSSTSDGMHFENQTISYEWSFSVILYSSDANIVNTKPEEIRAVLEKRRFYSIRQRARCPK